MSLPGFNPITSTTNTNNNNTNSNSNMNFMGGHSQQQHQQQLPHYPSYPNISAFNPNQHPSYHDPNSKHNMFSIPPPPPLASIPPPPFDRDISPPRKRTRTSPEQLAILEKSFTSNPSPNNRVREQLSHQLGMPERSIQIWFQNRRAKVKNQAKRSIHQVHDSTLYMQQQYAASAAAAACQSAAFQQQRDSIDPNLYYYYYYYYFHQQQQQQQQQLVIDTTKGNDSSEDLSSIPDPSSSFSASTANSCWSANMTPTSGNNSNNMIPDLTLSASTSSSSITSDNHHHYRRHPHHHRSSSASSISERTRAHSVGPYPYYRKSTPQERHSSLGPPPTTPNSFNSTPTQTINSNQFLFNNNNNLSDSRLYNSSTIIEEPYHITPSTGLIKQKQQKYNLSAQTLQIGSWKRVCDLTCQIDLSSRTLTWCIGDEQQRFRIDINLNLVQFIKKSNNRLEFFLSSPSQVKFYMTTTANDTWIQCHDFTQDKQASLENVHILESFDDLLQVEFMEILMHAPELQSLIIEEESTTMDSNLLLLQGLHLPQ